MEDLIKREDLIKAFKDVLDCDFYRISEETPRERIESIPSADRPNKTKAEMIAVMEEYRDKQLLMSDYWYGINWAINTIRTADISDEPSGEWIIRQPKPFFLCTCSACGETEEFMTKYCPNCGARMKGADDES